MKTLLTLTLLCFVIVFNGFAQTAEQSKLDSLSRIKDERYNPYKNTISWDVSNLFHTVTNTYYYENYDPYIGEYYQVPLGSATTSFYFRHRLGSMKHSRLDRSAYLRISGYFNFTTPQKTDSAYKTVSVTNGSIVVQNPQPFNSIVNLGASIGLEKDYNLGHFQLYYAGDIVWGYSNSNATGSYYIGDLFYNISNPNNYDYQYYLLAKDLSFGISPALGVNYYIGKRFSVGIETAFLLSYTIQSSESVQENLTLNTNTTYKLPNYYFYSGQFIPLKAIKVGFSF